MISEAAVAGGRNPALAAAGSAGAPNPERCPSCRGLLDPLSRQASQNSMGPWFVRDESNPFRPGCSIETLRRLAARAKIGPDTIIRGPTTRQFWMFARNTPGVANLFGECHSCHARVTAEDAACPACAAAFTVPEDRQNLGLGPVHLLPGHASPESIAAATPRAAGNGGSGGPVLLALGIAATLLGLAALGGTAVTGWSAVSPSFTRATQPANSGSDAPRIGETPAAPVTASTAGRESIKTPSETADAGAPSFQERWREHKRLSEAI